MIAANTNIFEKFVPPEFVPPAPNPQKEIVYSPTKMS